MTAEPAIRIEGLRKRYRIHHKASSAGGGEINRFSEQVVEWAKAPFRRIGQMARRAGHHDVPGGRGGKQSAGVEDFWALDDVGFDVQPGEVVGIVGRNGAGKSTLLKILSRITEPTAGRIELNGRVASLLEVGTGFHPELTGRENIFLNGSVLGMSRAEINGKFDEIVDFAEIERFLDTPVKRYSSGMYVRLAFAVAAHLEPEILIVDEVLAVGDANFQSKCLGKMSDVAKGGRTVLFVSHNMTAVQSLCESAVMLENGRLVQRGDTDDVLSRYLRSNCDAGSRVDFSRLPRSAGAAILRELVMRDPNGAEVSSVPIGGEVDFEVSGEAATKLRDATLGIRISRVTGERVATCLTSYQFREPMLLDGKFVLTASLKNLRLLAGQYHLRLILKSADGLVDDIEGVPFKVSEADIYGTGKQLPNHTGAYAPEVTWKVYNP